MSADRTELYYERALRESEAALRESEVWLAAQKEAFQAAVNGSSLETSLGILVRTARRAGGHRY